MKESVEGQLGTELPVAKVVSLVEQNVGAAGDTLLLIGSGELANTLLKQLGGQGVVVERATLGEAAHARARAPNLIVLAGDAAHDRGAAVIARLPQMDGAAPVPVLVLCAPESDGSTPEPAPRHVGFLSPDGGISECARRVQVVIELFMEVGLGACSLQQLTDTAAPRPKPISSATVPSLAAAPKKTPTTSHSPFSIRSAIASANRTATAARPAAARPSRQPPQPAAAAKPAFDQPRPTSAGSATRASNAPSIAPERTSRKPPSRAPERTSRKPSSRAPERTSRKPSSRAPERTSRKPSSRAPERTSRKPSSRAPERAPQTPATPSATQPALPMQPAPSESPTTVALTLSSASPSPPESRPQVVPLTPQLAEPVPPPESSASVALAPSSAPEHTLHTPPPIALAPMPAFDEPQAAENSAIAALAVSSASEPPDKLQPLAALAKARSAEPAGARAVSATAASLAPPVPEQTRGSLATSSSLDAPADETELTTIFWASALSQADSAPKVAAAPPARSEAQTSASISAPTVVETAAGIGDTLSERPTSPPELLSLFPDETDEPTIVRSLIVLQPVQTPDAVPKLVVSRSEPAASAVALDARVAQQPIQHPPVAPGAHSIGPRLEAPSLQQSSQQPSLATSSSSRSSASTRKRRAVLLYVVAAVGCTALLLRWLYVETDRSEGAAVAAGALRHAVIAETTPEHVAMPAARESPSAAQVVDSPIPPVASPPVVSSQVNLPSNPARETGPGGKLARAQALIEEGTALFNQGQLGLAESSLQQALASIPEHPKAMALLVRVHLARHDGAEAMRWAPRLLAKYPRNDAYQVLLGDAQALSGDVAAARTTWTEAARNGNSAARRRLE